MQVKKINIKSIMGISNLDITPGKITIVKGANGSGKTSTAEALISAIDGGSGATLIRNGEDKGEIVIVLDNDLTITKTIKESGAKTKLETDGVELPSPVTAIKKLFGPGFNPVRFISMKGKEQVEELLRVTPISIDDAYIANLIGTPALPGVDYSLHPVKLLAAIYAGVFDRRRTVNRQIKETESTIKVLTDSIVTVNNDVSIETMEEISSQLRKLQQKRHEIAVASTDRKTKINEEYQEALMKLNAEYNTHKMDEDNIHRTSDSAILTEIAELEYKEKQVRDAVSIVEQQKGTHKSISEHKDSLNGLEEKLTQYEKALRGLIEYKKKLINKDMFSCDISIDGDTISLDDIQFDKVNKAKQIAFAVELAEKSLGDVRFILVDGAEALDSESLAILEKEAMAKDIQLMLFTVSDDEKLTITSM